MFHENLADHREAIIPLVNTETGETLLVNGADYYHLTLHGTSPWKLEDAFRAKHIADCAANHADKAQRIIEARRNAAASPIVVADLPYSEAKKLDANEFKNWKLRNGWFRDSNSGLLVPPGSVYLAETGWKFPEPYTNILKDNNSK